MPYILHPLRKRRGKFSVWIETLDARPDLVALMTANICIVRAECLYYCNQMEYHGLSPMFDLCDMALESPRYVIDFTPDRGWFAVLAPPPTVCKPTTI